jgi:hypothetical protein
LQEDDFASPVRLAASEGDMSAVISALENIQCRVAYIPGNRDAATTAPPLDAGDAAPPRLTPHSCNVHNRCLRIAPDLVIVGLGGGARSAAATAATAADPADDKGDAHPGPPAGGADATLVPALAALLDIDPADESGAPPPPPTPPSGSASRLGQDCVLAGDAVVLLTFAAPEEAPGRGDDGGGGTAAGVSVGALLRGPAAQARVCLHAHSGGGAGGGGARATVGRIPAIDPGSLADGGYCLLTLARGGDGEAGGGLAWQLAACDFHSVYPPAAAAAAP